MFILVELLCGTWGGEEKGKNDKQSTIAKHITSVQVKGITI
jgi:hypothetical protein